MEYEGSIFILQVDFFLSSQSCSFNGISVQRESLHSSQVDHQSGTYSGFCSMKRLRVFLLPPSNGKLVNRKATPSILLAIIHLHTRVERGTVRVTCLLKNTTQCSRAGLEPGPLNLETIRRAFRISVQGKYLIPGLLISEVLKAKYTRNSPHYLFYYFAHNIDFLHHNDSI